MHDFLQLQVKWFISEHSHQQ